MRPISLLLVLALAIVPTAAAASEESGPCRDEPHPDACCDVEIHAWDARVCVLDLAGWRAG